MSKQYSAVCVGHVTIGGSVCMQMLTRSGWSPSNDIEVSLNTFEAHNWTHNQLSCFLFFPSPEYLNSGQS